MNKTILHSIFCVFLLAFSGSNFAQVTIGSIIKPTDGVLLDLKENAPDVNSVTSTKGLKLPRVELTDMTNLFPMFSDDGSGGYKIGTTPYTKATEDTAHTGLVVYNVNEDACASTPIYKGIYVWDGTQWQFIGNKEEPSPDVKYYTDTRPHGGSLAGTTQTYPYRNFGSVAGDWMLENMRYIPTDGSITEGLGGLLNSANKNYAYPSQTAVGTVPSSWRPNQGLLYTYSAATSGVQDGLSVNQGEGEPGEGPATPIQGVCPPNWHVPSDREWNELEAYIQNNMTDFSTETATQPWDPAWNTVLFAQSDNLGAAMKSECPLPTITTATNGKSFSTNQGGFNVLLAGFVDNSRVYSYGSRAILWSSSSGGGREAWVRDLGNGFAYVSRYDALRTFLFSVRCKKD